MDTGAIEVVEYRRAWALTFAELSARLAPALSGIAVAIEHVGSTAVPGLAAKPIVDLDIVVRDPQDARRAVAVLEEFGYEHRGNLGIAGREAFHSPETAPPHHLYVCVEGGLALRNHLAIRDRLRAEPQLATEYGALKRRLAAECGDDIERYIEGKSAFLVEVLRGAGFEPDELLAIERSNRRVGP